MRNRLLAENRCIDKVVLTLLAQASLVKGINRLREMTHGREFIP
jgi:hypothetical protein